MRSDEEIARDVPNALIPTKLELQYVRAGRRAVLEEVVEREDCDNWVAVGDLECTHDKDIHPDNYCLHCWASAELEQADE